ncbi:hypothetical protein BUALT_Bualt19G0018800 [Buddleja alternifolia]|uniref:C2H2-type domain-containing protein n=1 Tax=Buddleja alternifolia TaxID=168488 RepID=A0AAV6W191_9LAMI|nr:hypothetical protein BUALT_Bualt19G0018800 [Buddleja alternifolia]
MCGRALGGHMRAHGIGCENVNVDDDGDLTSDWEEKLGEGNDRPSIKRMYQLRTNPNRLKSCRICEHCGKEFLSWKSFLEHGKCSSDDGSKSLMSSPDSEGVDDGGTCGGSWSKRKRSVRTKVDDLTLVYPESEEEDLILARCLVELANTIVDPPMIDQEESSASREEEERRNPTTFVGSITSRANLDKVKGVFISNSKGLFECKACNKVFNSHQALGGHRASHKKVKGCYAAKQDQIQENILAYGDQELISQSKSTSSFHYEQVQGPTLVGAKKRKLKVHECSICHRVFSSGQALGGHKRCHWITSYSPDTSSLPKFQLRDNTEPIQYHYQPNIDKPEKLNLNFPAWANDMSGIRRDPLSSAVSTDMDAIDHGGKVNITCCDYQLYQPRNENDVSKKIKVDHHNYANNATNKVDDEADSKLKLAKLRELKDLKDINSIGNSSQWLQVGIGSITEATADS